jgi:hypothetical protein
MGYAESNTEYKQNNYSYLISYSSNLYFGSLFLRYYNYFNSIAGVFTEIPVPYGTGKIESKDTDLSIQH